MAAFHYCSSVSWSALNSFLLCTYMYEKSWAFEYVDVLYKNKCTYICMHIKTNAEFNHKKQNKQASLITLAWIKVFQVARVWFGFPCYKNICIRLMLSVQTQLSSSSNVNKQMQFSMTQNKPVSQ